jgi:hypothetical protein
MVDPPLIDTETDCWTLLMFPLFWEAFVIPATLAKAELKLLFCLDVERLLYATLLPEVVAPRSVVETDFSSVMFSVIDLEIFPLWELDSELDSPRVLLTLVFPEFETENDLFVVLLPLL